MCIRDRSSLMLDSVFSSHKINELVLFLSLNALETSIKIPSLDPNKINLIHSKFFDISRRKIWLSESMALMERRFSFEISVQYLFPL